MIIYHGSTKKVKRPKLLNNQRLLDFGKGFYTTTNQEQAERWAKIKQKRAGEKSNAIVSVYEINDAIFQDSELNTKTFPVADEEWLDFIVTNRKENLNHGFDIVKGAVANDTLYETLTLFETGVLSKPETISRLKAHKLFDQISFHTEESLSELKFNETYQI
ncbi:MAG: DUF3990 domain-containing protein [Paludibacteraceae bacterium]